MAHNFQTIRGVRDLIDQDVDLYNKILSICLKYTKLYNFQEIILPIFEHACVFSRTLGDECDILTKETYTFFDREKRMITLRPEFTAQIVRAILSNGLNQSMPKRLFTHGPLFRHERPQQGRYRQFYQFDCEIFGTKSPLADVEIIYMTYSILNDLDLMTNVQLEINTLGDNESSMRYIEVLKEYLNDHKNDLSIKSQEKIDKNPLRILDSKENKDAIIINNAPTIFHYLNQKSLDHYSSVCETLTSLSINYKTNTRLVRGLDYYIHTVFEFTTNKLGSQNAIAAGGRYDDLMKTMNGPDVPSVGVACGIDRIIELFKKNINISNEVYKPVCYIVPIGNESEVYALTLAENLRKNNISVILDYDLPTKKRLKIADREKYKLCLIFGENELKNNTLIIRNMSTGQEKNVHIEEVDEVILNIIQTSNFF